MSEFFTRLRYFFRPRPSSDLDDELQFHLEEATQANIAAGMTPEEARRQARIDFGGMESAREQTYAQRPGWWMETVLQDVRYALRGFRRNSIFTITVVATLTLGIGATTAVFSVVDPILFRPLPYAHADRLVSVGLVQSLETQEFTLGGFFFDWQRNQKPFEALTSEGAVSRECDLTERNPEQLHCMPVLRNFLTTLGVAPILGRNFSAVEMRSNGPDVAMISYALWKSRFNRSPKVLNQLIDIDGSQVRVIGVLPESFELPDLQPADVLMPLALDEAQQHIVNGSIGFPMRTFARLKPGVSIAQARTEFAPLFNDIQRIIPPQLRRSFQTDFHLRIRSLRDRQMQDASLIAWVLLGSVLAVLLIVCANVASLLMAHGATRRRELAVRAALGASRVRLARQALVEAFLLSIAATVAGCILAEVLLRIFIAIAPASIPFLAQAHLDLRIILFTVIVSVVCGALFGLASVLQKPSWRPQNDRTVASGSLAKIRQWLVIGQIAASVVLLTGGLLFLRSFWNLQHQQMGMRTQNTITVTVTLPHQNYDTAERQMAFFLQFENLLRFAPGVNSVAASDSVPPDPGHQIFFSSIATATRPATLGRTGGLVSSRLVSPKYFRTLGIPVIEGRGFQLDDVNSSEHFVVLSKQLATRLFPGKNAVGDRLQFHINADVGKVNTPWYTVAGVAANVKNDGLAGPEEPEYYLLRRDRAEDWSDNYRRTEVFILRTTLPPDVISRWIRAQVAKLDPIVLVNIETLTQRVSTMAARPRFETALVGFFAATGLLIALLGLYGIVAFIAIQRTQEIGVRMALGATRFNILRLILWQGGRLIMGGGLLGLGIALALARVLKGMLFSIGPYDPLSFLSVAILLGVVALSATLIPARRAMYIDPMEALRHE
ncbi:MAG: ABC transporter permease [Acidobacteriota bacterium]